MMRAKIAILDALDWQLEMMNELVLMMIVPEKRLRQGRKVVNLRWQLAAHCKPSAKQRPISDIIPSDDDGIDDLRGCMSNIKV